MARDNEFRETYGAATVEFLWSIDSCGGVFCLLNSVDALWRCS